MAYYRRTLYRSALLCFVLAGVVTPKTPAVGAPASMPQSCEIHNAIITGSMTLPLQGTSYVRFSSPSGEFREILRIPNVQSTMLLAESLLPYVVGSDKSAQLDCSVLPPFDAGNVPLATGACDSKNYTVVDEGPSAQVDGAVRSGNRAAIRLLVEQQNFFAAGVVTIDDWVGFSVDGAPPVALPAKGVEPVPVTAYFPNLPAGPHIIAIDIFDMHSEFATPQGTVCL